MFIILLIICFIYKGLKLFLSPFYTFASQRERNNIFSLCNLFF
ncbi:hypothetical protein HMPREF9446_00843 [Bacteroides fluxus YIT 12057]|uniref:Uncharacterized protein n=1 Tax=Bacteroides fluxus YIT 12057 TaxID=763034 RepID=F3PQ50_9BACE|nr:hypothetical protein HMPREF9446_00843 [Bacteroides fluxus YIT 12057]